MIDIPKVRSLPYVYNAGRGDYLSCKNLGWRLCLLGTEVPLLRSASQNSIPIDLLRTLTLIADEGSITRAANVLGLSQPAVSAQTKRLESLLGGDLFVKRGRIVQLSVRGQVILSYARRIVALDDQMKALSGIDANTERLRIGLPVGIDAELIGGILGSLSSGTGRAAFVSCDTQRSILRALDSGFLDVAFLADIGPIPASPLSEWTERWRWVKGPDLVLRPDAAVPLVSWPGSLSDRLCTTALRRADVAYLVTFAAPDRSLRKAAVNAGMGVMAASERSIKVSKLCVSHARILPELPEIRCGIYVRDGVDPKLGECMSRALQAVLNP